MANLKSIVDIDVNDAQFRRFSEMFEKYRQQLQKMPGAWAAIGKEHRAIAASMMAQNQLVREQTNLEQKQLSTLERAESLWRGMGSASGTVLRNVLGIGRTVLKWGSILGGGLLGGSLWGLNRMAEGVSATRYNSMGLGMSYGGYRSFGVNMSRFIDPGSFLASINQAISNPALATPLYALGVNPNGSTENVSLAMLKAMRRLAINTPRNELGLMSQAYGLEPYGGLEALMRLRKVSAEEFYKQLTAERKDKSGLGLPAGVQRAWTDFTTQMHLAGATIETTLVKRLAPLAGPLTKLSGSIVDLIDRVMKKDGPLEKGIDTLASWINNFNGKITTPQFFKSVDKFMASIGALAEWAKDTAVQVGAWKAAYDAVRHPFSKGIPQAWDYWTSGAGDAFRRGMHSLATKAALGIQNNNPGNLKFAGQSGAIPVPGGFAAFPTAQAGLVALGKQLELYAGRGNTTVSGIIGKYAPPSENDTAGYIADVARKMGVSANARLDLKNPSILTSMMRAIIGHENGRNPYGAAVGAAANIVIHNATGGNAVVAVNGMAR